MYWETRIRDFILLSILWMTVVGTAVLASMLNSNWHISLYWQIREILLVAFFFSVFHHANHMYLPNCPTHRSFRIFMGGYALTLILLVLLWRPLLDLSWIFPRYPFAEPPSFGFTAFGLVYSPEFPQIRNLFGLLSFSYFVYVHWQVKPLIQDLRVLRSLLLWRIAGVCGLLFSLIQTFWFVFAINPDIRFVFAFLAIIPIALIALFYPEGMLITQAQIYRALRTYAFAEMKSETSLTHLMDYLSRVREVIKND
ncbi:MAG: hypothetical protein D6732_13060 [Methanobacteriota archaeon]|nr:MAG: hypothetical protein D6732_13060 [Euryarchaeota archaeon]